MTSLGTPARSRWFATVVLLLAAAAVHLLVAVPARRDRDEAREGFARARQDRERLRARASRLEKSATITAHTPSGDAAAARAMRLSFLRATDGLALESLTIETGVGRRGGTGVHGTLVAEGGQTDLLRAAERLAEPSSGVALDRLRLATSREQSLRLDLEASSAGVPAEAPDGRRGQGS